jgi:ribosome-associated toxin RatA of RatAB toxin-antitoxin module
MKAGAAVLTVVLAAGPAAGEEILVNLREDNRAYQLVGRFETRAPRPVAWAVLTDYEGIDRFVSSVLSSRVAEPRNNRLMVEQEMSARVLFFARRVGVRLAVREDPMREIAFQDLSGKDFARYAGAWTLREEAGRVEVRYRVEARPRFSAPGFLLRGAFQKSVKELLTEVRAEMERRAQAPIP